MSTKQTKPMKLVSIGECAKQCSVTIQTLRRWAKLGHLTEYRTPTGHRKFSLDEVKALLHLQEEPVAHRHAVIYARVSTKKQADAGNLERQKERLLAYANEHDYEVKQIYTDIASGLNEKRKGLQFVFQFAKKHEGVTIIIEYKDRLARFGYTYLIDHLKSLGATVLVLEEVSTNEETELVNDLIAITTSFSARIYGKRGGIVPKTIRQLLKTGVETHENDDTSLLDSTK